MDPVFMNVSRENIENEHLCCAMTDKKHRDGVAAKKAWLKMRMDEGHVFRKLQASGKVFIEYAPLETAWVPVTGDNYLYIYCLWVSGSFKGKGYGKALLAHCLADARKQQKAGVCILSAKTKKPFLAEKKFMQACGFQSVDKAGEYELLAISFDGTTPQFTEAAKEQAIGSEILTIYYGLQCPYIPQCVKEVRTYCQDEGIPLALIQVDTLEKAKSLPGIFNNWAVFYNGKMKTLQLLNAGALKKFLGSC